MLVLELVAGAAGFYEERTDDRRRLTSNFRHKKTSLMLVLELVAGAAGFYEERTDDCRRADSITIAEFQAQKNQPDAGS